MILFVWKYWRFFFFVLREFWYLYVWKDFWVIVCNCFINYDLEMIGFINDSGGLVMGFS